MLTEVFPPVLTKRDFVRRFAAGEFGNRGPVWDKVEDFVLLQNLADTKGRLYHLRNRRAGGSTYYNLDSFEAVTRWLAMGMVERENWYIAEMAPTEKTIIQGEVRIAPAHANDPHLGLSLFVSTIAKPMREALKLSAFSFQGIIANSVLRTRLCPNSYDWLMTLLDRYPDHVVEFSTYSTNWGVLPNFNTVFWEVRKY